MMDGAQTNSWKESDNFEFPGRRIKAFLARPYVPRLFSDRRCRLPSFLSSRSDGQASRRMGGI